MENILFMRQRASSEMDRAHKGQDTDWDNACTFELGGNELDVKLSCT